MNARVSVVPLSPPVGKRVDVLGVHISAVNMSDCVEAMARWIEKDLRSYVCVTGVHGVMECQRDAELRRIHNCSGLTTPDGMPMVWASHWAGAADVSRVYGPDLLLAACDRGEAAGWRMFFYGGAPLVAETLATRLAERFEGLQIVGTLSPPFRDLTEEEDDDVVARINTSQADIVWIGLSTPKQERWMATHRDRLTVPVLVGVGAAFDIHAGTLRQAPPWMQRAGLEWLYRLRREPRRLWRRYAVNNPWFLMSILRRPPRLLGGRRADDGHRQ